MAKRGYFADDMLRQAGKTRTIRPHRQCFDAEKKARLLPGLFAGRLLWPGRILP